MDRDAVFMYVSFLCGLLLAGAKAPLFYGIGNSSAYPSLPEANLVNERSSFFYRVSSRAACLQINLKFSSMNFPETVAESLDNSGENILYIIGSSETMSDAVQGLNELALAVKCKNKHRR